VAPLKRLPVAESDTRTLQLPAPYEDLQIVRTIDVPTGLVRAYFAATVPFHVKDRQPTVQDLHKLTVVVVMLINATIVRWNLPEYARRDGKPYSDAGAVTIADLDYMPRSLHRALIGALLSGDKDAEKDTKKA
jgi:hypothetical protein